MGCPLAGPELRYGSVPISATRAKRRGRLNAVAVGPTAISRRKGQLRTGGDGEESWPLTQLRVASRNAACKAVSSALRNRERSFLVRGAGAPVFVPSSRRCLAISRPTSALPILLRAHHPFVACEQAIYFLAVGPKCFADRIFHIELRGGVTGKALRPDDMREGRMNGAREPCHGRQAPSFFEQVLRQQSSIRELFSEISQDGNVFREYIAVQPVTGFEIVGDGQPSEEWRPSAGCSSPITVRCGTNDRTAIRLRQS
jgi:hypothetical protein